MQSKVGLTSWSCLGCNCVSYASVRVLLQFTTIECIHCHASFSVSDIEESNPSLKRILVILRQLANTKEIHRQRQEQASALKEMNQVSEKV